MQESLKVIRYPQLKQKIGVSRPTVFRWMRDGVFPKSIKLGSNSVGWIESEVEAWLEEKIKR